MMGMLNMQSAGSMWGYEWWNWLQDGGMEIVLKMIVEPPDTSWRCTKQVCMENGHLNWPASFSHFIFIPFNLKRHGPISENGVFVNTRMVHHHPRNLGVKFQLNQSNHLHTWRDYVYCNCLYNVNGYPNWLYFH